MKTIIAFLLLAAAAHAQTNDDIMARYQGILDRVPFGLVQPGKMGHATLGFGRYAFVGVVSLDPENTNRVAVIHDRQTNQYHFKAEGEPIDDIKVNRIENLPTGRKLILQRGADMMTLSYAQETHDGVAPPPSPFGPPPPVATGSSIAGAERVKPSHAHGERPPKPEKMADRSSERPNGDRSSYYSRNRERPQNTKSPRQ
jgi:hypothetical protein